MVRGHESGRRERCEAAPWTARLTGALVAVSLVLTPVPVPASTRAASVPDEPESAAPAAAAHGSPDFVRGAWVVSLARPISAGSRRALKDAGVAVERVSRDGLRAVVASGAPVAGVMGRLKRIKGVEWAEPLVRVRASRAPNDPAYPQQWGLPAVGAPAAWDVTRGDTSVRIAIIDTGVDRTHPEFAGRLTSGYDFVNRDADPNDDEGHGTHVAGIAAAAADNALGGTGLAPKCRIVPVKVLGADGGGDSFTVAEGIRYAADSGAAVLNLSLDSRSFSQSIADAVAYALGRDVVVVAAAGNDGAGVGYPAKLPGVVGVSAVDSSLRLASFSNRGAEIDLAAPGVDILSTLRGGGMVTANGTSMAAPFVAAAAALVRSRNPALTQAQVVSRLTNTATDLGVSGPDASFGAGMLDAARALGAASAGSDDDIPGVVLPPSPVVGSLSVANDADDVFAVTLQAGQRFMPSLSGPAGTDFDLLLYGPSAQRLGGTERPVIAADGAAYPKRFAYVAPEGGTYFLDVRAVSGSGSYTLTWAISAPDPTDDDVPGVALPPSPVIGTLARGLDDDDVFRVSLGPGDRLEASLIAAAGTDFDLYLFAPDAPTVSGDHSWLTKSAGNVYPETIDYTATKAGTYYLDAFAYAGSGSYTLTWSVTRPASDGDDDIPGRALPPSPVAGTLSASSDTDDVFWIDLAAGQEIIAGLAGSAGTDFDLYLYGPGATRVVPPDQPVAFARSTSYPDRLSYVVPVSGRYYLDVFAFSGSGSYTLDWLTTSVGADNRIPGVAAPPSPITGVLDDSVDEDDVYRIQLTAGQQISVSLTGAVGTDFDLYLFGPDAVDVDADDALVASYLSRYPERITFLAPLSGTYYLDVYAYEGAGPYEVAYHVGPAMARPTSLDFDARMPVGTAEVSLRATLRADDGRPVEGAAVAFQAYSGTSWRHVAFGTTGVDGTAEAAAAGMAVRRFRVQFTGDASHLATISAIVEVGGRSATETTLSASTRVPAYGGSVTLSARSRDLYTGTPLTAAVQIERLVGSRWVEVASTRSTDGSLRATVRPASATTYRAVFVGSATLHPSNSDEVVIKPRVSLTPPSAPQSVKRGVRFTASGVLRPRHSAGSSVLWIRCYRLEGSAWVQRRAVAARISDIAGGSRYSASITLPSGGSWRLRAYRPPDARHSATLGPASRTIPVP